MLMTSAPVLLVRVVTKPSVGEVIQSFTSLEDGEVEGADLLTPVIFDFRYAMAQPLQPEEARQVALSRRALQDHVGGPAGPVGFICRDEADLVRVRHYTVVGHMSGLRDEAQVCAEIGIEATMACFAQFLSLDPRQTRALIEEINDTSARLNQRYSQ